MAIVPIDKTRHATIRVKIGADKENLSRQHMVPLVASEMALAAMHFPVVFVKESETGFFRCVALMGLEPGENLLLRNGELGSDYVPLNLRRYPFFLSDVGGQGDMVVCLDESSELTNDSEGEHLFDENGAYSPFLKEVAGFLAKLLEKKSVTDEFIKMLVHFNLLKVLDVETPSGSDGRKKKIGGIYAVDEVKLRKLPPDAVLAFHKWDFFAAIYAHLNSFGQFRKLARLKAYGKETA